MFCKTNDIPVGYYNIIPQTNFGNAILRPFRQNDYNPIKTTIDGRQYTVQVFPSKASI
jgi:hypothetical protein